MDGFAFVSLDQVQHHVDVMTSALPSDMDYGEFSRTDLCTLLMVTVLESLGNFIGSDDIPWSDLATDRDKRHRAGQEMTQLALKLADSLD